MTYQAITIDAQTVYANGRHLDRGVVGQMVQYKGGPIQVLLTEIVLREIIAMLVTKAKTANDALEKAIKEGDSNGQLSGEQKASLQSALDGMPSADLHAKTQMKNFVEVTGSHVIPAEKVAIGDVLNAYFGKKPPFSSKGKKDEFPDAISLLTLEAWAKEENKRVLAVSNDGDWKAFAAQSEWIDCVDDLAEAMEMLVATVEATELEASNVLKAMMDGTQPELRDSVFARLAHAIEMETPYVEFSSSMSGQDEGATLALIDFEIYGADTNETDITIVRVTPEGFVMQVPISIKAQASVDISFSIHDSIDDDDVPMGSTSVEREVEFEAYALIECSRHQINTDGGDEKTVYEIDDAEIVDAPSSIDIGYVDYSLADDEPDYDPQEWNTDPPTEPETASTLEQETEF